VVCFFVVSLRGSHYIVVNIVTTPLCLRESTRPVQRANAQRLTTSNYVIAEELLTEPVPRPVIQWHSVLFMKAWVAGHCLQGPSCLPQPPSPLPTPWSGSPVLRALVISFCCAFALALAWYLNIELALYSHGSCSTIVWVCMCACARVLN